MSEGKVSVYPDKQALLGLGIENETPLATIERVFAAKNSEYGDSWCKRGELAFVASMARKVDRLGTCQSGTVGAFDTKLDLAVYMALYNVLLAQRDGDTTPVHALFAELLRNAAGPDNKYLLWLNLPLIREIENAYSVFFEDSLFETLRYQPRLFGERVVDPSVEFVEWPCEENKALALTALDQAWALYYREHSYIKALCGWCHSQKCCLHAGRNIE